MNVNLGSTGTKKALTGKSKSLKRALWVFFRGAYRYLKAASYIYDDSASLYEHAMDGPD